MYDYVFKKCTKVALNFEVFSIVGCVNEISKRYVHNFSITIKIIKISQKLTGLPNLLTP